MNLDFPTQPLLPRVHPSCRMALDRVSDRVSDRFRNRRQLHNLPPLYLPVCRREWRYQRLVNRRLDEATGVPDFLAHLFAQMELT